MRFLLALLLMLVPVTANAVVGVPDSRHWVPAGFGGGGNYSRISADHFTPNKIYAIPDVQAPYVSTNSGESWTPLSYTSNRENNYGIAQTAAFVQSTNDANLMFAIDDSTFGAFKSSDGGQTWKKVGTLSSGRGDQPIAINPSDDNMVYGQYAGNVYRSTDKGDTFAQYINYPFSAYTSPYTTKTSCESAGFAWSTSANTCYATIKFIYVDAVNNDLWIGSSNSGMVRYDMDTSTINYVTLTGTNASRTTNYGTYIDASDDLNFCVGAGLKIACTTDYTNWTYTEALTASSSYFLSTFSIHKKNDDSINIVANLKLISNSYSNTTKYSTDGGATWATSSRVNDLTNNPTGNFNAGNLVRCIEDDPFNDGVFYLTTDGRIYRSDDNGLTFNEKSIGAQIIVAEDIAISPTGRMFVVAMDTGVQYSDDFGITWTQGTPHVGKGQAYNTFNATDYGGHYWRVKTAGTYEDWVNGDGKVYMTATIYAQHSSIYYKNFLIRSLDNGETYTRSISGLPQLRLFGGMWGNGYARGLALSADESTIYVAMDGGNNTDGSQTKGGLFKSTDGGVNFTQIWKYPNIIYNAIAIDPTDTDNETVLFGTYNSSGVWHRTVYSDESAELNGSGQTRTGNLNKYSTVISGSVVFETSGDETFTDTLNSGETSGSTNTLSSNLGGTGTINYSTGAYTLNMISTPGTATVSYGRKQWVADSYGPSGAVGDVTYDSQGTPYIIASSGGMRVYKSVQTAYGDGSGSYGTWRTVGHFNTSGGYPESIIVDKGNDNRVFASASAWQGSTQHKRVWVTNNANKNEQSKWYDITGDLPATSGCKGLAINPYEGTQGYLYCASGGAGIWKLNLQDSISSNPGRTNFGGSVGTFASDIPYSREWQNAGFGASGTFPMITADNEVPNKIYMTSDVAGNFYSNDAGDQWRFMNVGTTTILNTAIAQSESNPDVLYSIGKKLIKSVDRGKSWTTLGTYATRRPASYKVIAINRDDENIFYFATTNGKIYRSLNGGNTIDEYATPFGTNVAVEFLYINPAGTRLVAGNNGQGMVSYNLSTDVATDIDFVNTNGTYNNDFGTYDNSGTEVFCVTAGTIIKCTSNFTDWTDTTEPVENSLYYMRRMAVRKLANNEIRFIIWSRQLSTQYGVSYVSVSSDSGDTWNNVENSITEDHVNLPTDIWASFGNIGTVFSIVSDPHDEDQFWIATDFRIFRSNDGGMNWTEKVKGAQNQVVSDLACSPRMTNGTTRCFQAGMDIGLLYSDDVGDTWVAAFPNTSNGGPQGFAVAGHIWRVVTRGTQAEWDAGTGQVVATTSNWADFISRVIYSNDNGVTWTITTSGLPTTQLNGSSGKHRAGWGIGYPRALAKCTDNDDILALGIDGYSATEQGGIFVSTDGGVNWSRTTQPDQWKTYNGISFDPSDNSCNTIVFGEFFYNSPDLPKTWRTTDRGATWTSVENDIGVFDLKFGPDGKAYKVGLDTNPMIDRSVDGINWSNMNNLNTTSQISDGLWIDENNANRICVGVNDGTNTGVNQGSGNNDGSGAGGGSVYCTGDAQNGSSASWYHITGDLPSPAGVTAITAVYGYQGHDWLLVGTDGSGTFRLKLNDRSRTTISNVRFND